MPLPSCRAIVNRGFDAGRGCLSKEFLRASVGLFKRDSEVGFRPDPPDLHECRSGGFETCASERWLKCRMRRTSTLGRAPPAKRWAPWSARAPPFLMRRSRCCSGGIRKPAPASEDLATGIRLAAAATAILYLNGKAERWPLPLSDSGPWPAAAAESLASGTRRSCAPVPTPPIPRGLSLCSVIAYLEGILHWFQRELPQTAAVLDPLSLACLGVDRIPWCVTGLASRWPCPFFLKQLLAGGLVQPRCAALGPAARALNAWIFHCSQILTAVLSHRWWAVPESSG